MRTSKEDDMGEERSRFDGKRLVKDFSSIMNHPYYQQFIPEIETLVKATKDTQNYKDPRKHFGMQLEIFRAIQLTEKYSSEGKKSAKKESNEELAIQSKRNKYLSKAFKEITDGIAWRTLGYDRFVLKVMSHGRSPGHSWGKDDGRKAELQRARNVVDNGAFVLINDVTNVLRIGDLMCIPRDSKGISIAEIKKRELITARSIQRKMSRKMKLDTQEYRLLQAQISIDDRVFSLSEDRVDLVEVIPAKADFMPTVSAVLKKSMSDGVGSRLVAPYLHVDAIDLRLAYEMDIEQFKRKMDAIEPPQSTPLFDHSNYDRIAAVMSGEVMRSALPYTVYPFSAKAITKLITGEILMTATIYFEPMQVEFAKYGWDFVVNEKVIEAYKPKTDEDYVKDFSGKILFPDTATDNERPSMMMLRNKKTGFNFPIGDMLAQMASEFISVKYIVSVVQQVEAIAAAERAAGKPNKLKFLDIRDEWRWQ